ncbi:MAG TPA: MGMT family protein [Candidatus Nanoarchaeia archaeon]|nr:MGMT family protein [Candidatus Nanoarchaeia archaeon]
MNSFADKVYELCKNVPRGKVSTYKEIARALKCKGFQAVGQALNKNPYAPVVPCHRIVNSRGELHGFAFGLKKKKELLESEGVVVVNNKVDLEKFGFYFP